MRTCGSRWRLFVDLLAQVEVPLRVRVREPRTVAVYWTAMLVVLGFGGGYMLYYQRGYQTSGDIAASSEFRFRGTAAVRTATGELSVQYRNSTCASLGRRCNASRAAPENGCPEGAFANGGLLTGRCISWGTNQSLSSGIGGYPGYPAGGVGAPSPVNAGERPSPSPGLLATADRGTCEVVNWGNLTWSLRVNVKMLSSTDSNNKLKTWSQELGPFTIASVITGHSLLDEQLSKEIYKALGPAQVGVDVAFSIGFFCDLDKPMRLCGLRQSNPDTEAAPFAAFRLDSTGTRTTGAVVTETDMIYPDTRILRNMTGLRLRLAITGESRESDLYTTIFNLGTILWVTFISQWAAERVLLQLIPGRKYYQDAVYKQIDDLHSAGTGRHQYLPAAADGARTPGAAGGGAGLGPGAVAPISVESVPLRRGEWQLRGNGNGDGRHEQKGGSPRGGGAGGGGSGATSSVATDESADAWRTGGGASPRVREALFRQATLHSLQSPPSSPMPATLSRIATDIQAA